MWINPMNIHIESVLFRLKSTTCCIECKLIDQQCTYHLAFDESSTDSNSFVKDCVLGKIQPEQQNVLVFSQSLTKFYVFLMLIK